MRKTIATVLVIVSLLCCAAGGFLFHVQQSPEYELKKIIAEVKENGVITLQDHLTSNMKTQFKKVFNLMQHPIARFSCSLLGLNNEAKVLEALEQNKGELKVHLINVLAKGGTSIIQLLISGTNFSGEIEIEMAREHGKWLIGGISLPISSWLFDRT